MKKAQIQMTENVIILFIFFILLIFAIVFFTRISSTKVQQEKAVSVQNKGLEIAQSVELLPELRCTKRAVTVLGCYDLYGAIALSNLARSGQFNDYYFPLFGYSTIAVQQIYPQEGSPVVIYNNSKANFTTLIPTQVPMLLCNYTKSVDKGTCSFGVLTVHVYN